MNSKILWVSFLYGGLAGAISALTLMAMLGLQHHIWALGSGPLFIFATVMVGGILLAALQHRHNMASLNQAIAEASDPARPRARKTGVLALSAIIAVAFGASIGPEAGLVAVVAELSILVSSKIARTREEARALGEAGTAAALASVYGSPPAAASYADDSLTPSKVPSFLAGVSGFLVFMAVLNLLGAERHIVELPLAPRGDVSTWWQALLPALLASSLALFFGWLHHRVDHFAERFARPWARVLLGSTLLAGLLAAVPLLRFSGHAELPELVTLVEDSAWWALAGLALLKVLATVLSLSAGWPGGEFFPLAFAGAAAGLLATALLPGTDAGTALAAGMVAATTVAVKKPLAIVLIMVFMLPGTALGPLLVASAVGTLVVKLVEARNSGAAKEH
ncbi:chloride channel protein [Rothia nasimurium]|uniref:chloride channel protein n=1 Tax=Rothia nasimurium TaxID=85336 RepID=UPI003BA28B40